MHHKLLAAVDHSPAAQSVLQEAIDMAKGYQAQMLLVHVISAEEQGSPFPIPQGIESMYWASGSDLNIETWRQQWMEYEKQCLKDLHQLADQVAGSGIDVEVRQVSGTPGRMICQIANEWEADLIVVGNQGRSGLSEMVLGSVSNYVLHHAKSSVLIIKNQAAKEA